MLMKPEEKTGNPIKGQIPWIAYEEVNKCLGKYL
jgi:hypothetical protein